MLLKGTGQIFDQENFILEYFEIGWSNLLNLNEKKFDLTIINFLIAMNSLLDKYAPFKKISKCKLKFKKKLNYFWYPKINLY